MTFSGGFESSGCMNKLEKNVKNTMLLSLGINEGEDAILFNKKFNQVDIFTDLGGVIKKMMGVVSKDTVFTYPGS